MDQSASEGEDEDEGSEPSAAAAGAAGSAASLSGDEKKVTKTAAKKAKKEAARKAEEERAKAEADAKRKAEEVEKKKAKKAKKAKQGDKPADAAAAASPSESPSASASRAASARSGSGEKEEAGWEVQKSDKPSASKQAGSHKATASSAASPGKASAAPGSGSSKGSKAAHADGEHKEAASSNPGSSDAYEEMYIPFKHHAQLIGAKGATLQQLQSTGAKVDMPKKDSGSTKVQLTGSAEAVRACKGAIESLISRGYSTVTHPGWVHDDVSVEERHFGLIIGPGGKYIQAIQQKTATRINLPDKDSGSTRVTIVGKKEDVRSARLAIKELITDGFSPLTHEQFVKREVAFPKDKLHILIGAKGQTIKSIQGNSKAKINIPERGSGVAGEDARITVVGTPEAVAQAEKEIARLLIPVQVVEEEPEEEYRDGTWAQAQPTEDELWE